MNEAVAPAIDRDAAAALIEPLTELVIRAGAAILAVNRSAMKVDGKSDGSPVTEADLAADRIIARRLSRGSCRTCRRCRRSARIWRQPPYQGKLLPDRPARRHQGIRRRPQRVHGQSRAGDRRHAAARHRRRAGAWVDLARHCRPRRRAADLARRCCPREGADPHPPCPPPGKPWTVAVSRSHGDPGTEAFIAARPGAVRTDSARRSNSAGSPRARSISIPACRRPANGTSRPATRWLPPPAARSRIQRARRSVRPGKGFSRAGVHRLGRSGGECLLSVIYCARLSRNSGQRALASLMKRPGSAAKASRLSSRSNR